MSPAPYRGLLGWLVSRPIAHRGLHDGNVARMENSLPACQAAVVAGYAIECDVRLSADGVPMVFHDAALGRLTGEPGELADRAAAELTEMRLGTTAATIPTLAALLDAVDGQVPVLVELKGTSPNADQDFGRRIQPALDAYRGPLALMSFDAWLIEAALALGTHAVGLTAEGRESDVLAVHRAAYARGCRFVSYNVHHLPNAFTRSVAEGGAPLLSWTVRTPAEVAQSRAHAHQMTFEGFLPQP